MAVQTGTPNPTPSYNPWASFFSNKPDPHTNNPFADVGSDFSKVLGGLGSAFSSIFNPFGHTNQLHTTAPYRPQSALSLTNLAGFGANTHTATTPAVTQSPTGYSSSYGGTMTGPTNFSIDTSGAIPSSYLDKSFSNNDITAQRSAYEQAVQKLAEASQYSPAYMDAYKKVQTLGAQQDILKGNLAAGNVPGDTEGFAEGFTNRASMGAAAQEGLANIGLQAEALSREGDIAGAQALVAGEKPQEVSPGSSLVSPTTGQATYGGQGAYSDYQAQQTYFNLAQNFPDAQIPAYDPTMSPQQNLQQAQQLASRAPSFQSKNLVQVQLPGGGISFVNRNQIVTGPDGSYTVVSPAQAAQADGISASIKDLTNQQSVVQRAVAAADQNFPLLLGIVKKAGINDFSSPLANQLEQAANRKVIGSGDQAAFNVFLQSLQTEYSQILARGGTVTNMTREEGDSLISGTLGFTALTKVYQALQTEAKNNINSYSSTINGLTGQLNSLYSSSIGSGGYSGGGGGGTSGGGSIWDF